MMIRFGRGVLLTLLVAASSWALAAEPSERQKLNEAMELYGLSMIIQHIPRDVADGLSQDDFPELQGLTRDQADIMKRVLASAFKADRIRRDVVKRLQGHYDAARISGVLAQLHRPLYTKISKLEKRANTPEAASDFENFVAGLALHAPDRGRVEVMKSLDRASHSTEIAAAIQVAIAKALMRCVAAYDPGSESLSDEQIDALLTQVRRRISETVGNRILVWSLYTYRSLSDDELRDYVALYEDRNIQWFTRVSSDALLEAMDGASARAVQGIVTLRNAVHI